MKLYLYCLAGDIDALRAPAVGISGVPVELLKLQDFSLLVSRFSVESALVTRENILTHDNVVRSVLHETTPLPFRFGCVVTEQQLDSYLNIHRTDLKAKLAQVRGCVEMSVKIIWNTEQSEFKETADAEGPGTRFLEEKRREILGGERRSEEARQVAVWLKEQVGAYVRQEELSLCPTEKLIVTAAHLISREDVTEYRDRLADARKTRSELHFLVSGPWPPYTFSNIGLEVKTRFGVS